MGRRHDELMERATAVPVLLSDTDRVLLAKDEHVLLPWESGRAAFLSSTHRAKDIEETLEAFEKVLPHLHQEDLP